MPEFLRGAQSLLLACTIVSFNALGQSPTVPSLSIQEIDSPAGAASGEPNLYASADARIYLS